LPSKRASRANRAREQTRQSNSTLFSSTKLASGVLNAVSILCRETPRREQELQVRKRPTSAAQDF
jgi:hypothetical protein